MDEPISRRRPLRCSLWTATVLLVLGGLPHAALAGGAFFLDTSFDRQVLVRTSGLPGDLVERSTDRSQPDPPVSVSASGITATASTPVGSTMGGLIPVTAARAEGTFTNFPNQSVLRGSANVSVVFAVVLLDPMAPTDIPVPLDFYSQGLVDISAAAANPADLLRRGRPDREPIAGSRAADRQIERNDSGFSLIPEGAEALNPPRFPRTPPPRALSR